MYSKLNSNISFLFDSTMAGFAVSRSLQKSDPVFFQSTKENIKNKCMISCIIYTVIIADTAGGTLVQSFDARLLFVVIPPDCLFPLGTFRRFS